MLEICNLGKPVHEEILKKKRRLQESWQSTEIS